VDELLKSSLSEFNISTLFLNGFSHFGGVDDLILIFERRDSDDTGGRAIFFLNTGFGVSVKFSFFF